MFSTYVGGDIIGTLLMALDRKAGSDASTPAFFGTPEGNGGGSLFRTPADDASRHLPFLEHPRAVMWAVYSELR